MDSVTPSSSDLLKIFTTSVASSEELKSTFKRAEELAASHKHQYTTLEHLLLALTEDKDAVDVMQGCNVDPKVLKRKLEGYIKEELGELIVTNPAIDTAKPTAGLLRTLTRARNHVQASGREAVTGANVLVALFSERESHAVYFLLEQDMTRFDAVTYVMNKDREARAAQTSGEAIMWKLSAEATTQLVKSRLNKQLVLLCATSGGFALEEEGITVKSFTDEQCSHEDLTSDPAAQEVFADSQNVMVATRGDEVIWVGRREPSRSYTEQAPVVLDVLNGRAPG